MSILSLVIIPLVLWGIIDTVMTTSSIRKKLDRCKDCGKPFEDDISVYCDECRENHKSPVPPYPIGHNMIHTYKGKKG